MNRRYFCDAFGAVEVEGDAGVHAALAEVAVQARPGLVAVAELVVQLVQVPQVVPEPVRGDGGVFPAFPRVAVAGHVRGRAQAGLADRPQLVLAGGIVVEGDVGLMLGVVQGGEHVLGGLVHLVAGMATELDHEVRGARGEFVQGLGVPVMELLVGDEAVVQALQGDRLALAVQDARDGVRRPVDAGVAEDDERPFRQHVRPA